MDIRYRHPQVAYLWDRPWTYDAWWRIEQAVTRAQLDQGLIPSEYVPHARVLLGDEMKPKLDEIIRRELVTKHDVVAFLQVVREWWGEPHARWIHYGLTSSDIVDTAQGLRFKAMVSTLTPVTMDLLDAAESWLQSGVPMLGRTHGMPAEPTAMRVRAAHWVALLRPAVTQLLADTNQMRLAKISGPVGTYAHIPPGVEIAVAKDLGLDPVMFGGSQIAPRGGLGRWANSAAELVQACTKIAMDVRLMTTHREIRSYQSAKQVGSSSMPHKNNPIRAEQITGLARLAAGYASMLQPLDLWLERDISHSCVERVAVPDLWHILLHAIDQTTTLLYEMTLDLDAILKNLEDNANVAYTRHVMLEAIADGENYAEAREIGLGADVESYSLSQDAERDFLSDYPKTTP